MNLYNTNITELTCSCKDWEEVRSDNITNRTMDVVTGYFTVGYNNIGDRARQYDI